MHTKENGPQLDDDDDCDGGGGGFCPFKVVKVISPRKRGKDTRIQSSNKNKLQASQD